MQHSQSDRETKFKFNLTGTIQVLLAVMSITMGATPLVIQSNAQIAQSLMDSSLSGIWGGAIMFISGVHGWIAYPKQHNPSKLIFKMTFGASLICVISSILMGDMCIAAAISYPYDSYYPEDTIANVDSSYTYDREEAALALVVIYSLMSTVAVISTLVSFVQAFSACMCCLHDIQQPITCCRRQYNCHSRIHAASFSTSQSSLGSSLYFSNQRPPVYEESKVTRPHQIPNTIIIS